MKQHQPKRLCIDCYNFKTKVVTEKTLKRMYSHLRATFIGKVNDIGAARLWWCSKSQLHQQFYTEKYFVERLCKESCKFWDSD